MCNYIEIYTIPGVLHVSKLVRSRVGHRTIIQVLEAPMIRLIGSRLSSKLESCSLAMQLVAVVDHKLLCALLVQQDKHGIRQL